MVHVTHRREDVLVLGLGLWWGIGDLEEAHLRKRRHDALDDVVAGVLIDLARQHDRLRLREEPHRPVDHLRPVQTRLRGAENVAEVEAPDRAREGGQWGAGVDVVKARPVGRRCLLLYGAFRREGNGAHVGELAAYGRQQGDTSTEPKHTDALADILRPKALKETRALPEVDRVQRRRVFIECSRIASDTGTVLPHSEFETVGVARGVLQHLQRTLANEEEAEFLQAWKMRHGLGDRRLVLEQRLEVSDRELAQVGRFAQHVREDRRTAEIGHPCAMVFFPSRADERALNYLEDTQMTRTIAYVGEHVPNEATY